MKKIFCIAISFLLLIFLPSCSKTIPNSAEACEKLQKLGYEVDLIEVLGDDAEEIGIKQMIRLDAKKDSEIVLQVYYFSNAEDTVFFFENYGALLKSDVEAFRKNEFSIWRGKQMAVDDLLS